MWLERYRKSRVVGCVIAALLVGILLSAASSPLPFTPLSDGDVESFSFIVYGDIQDNYRNGHQALVNLMLKEDAAFVVNTGDIFIQRGKRLPTRFLSDHPGPGETNGLFSQPGEP